MISENFREKVKSYPGPKYQLAWKAGLHPVTLSQIMIGYLRPRPGDSHVIRVGEILGLSPDECFVEPEKKWATQ